MIFLLDFCTFPWWLAWLLPFLLGLLLGWLLWARYKRLLAQAEADLSDCRKRGNKLEEELAECRKSYTAIDNENATLRGRIREMEADLRASAESEETEVEANIELADTKVDLSATGVTGLTADLDPPTIVTPDVDLSSSIAADADSDAGSSLKVGSDNMYAALKEDNLQVLEGIGPKMESVLKDNGIATWKELAGKSGVEVKAILSSEKYGRKYQIIDPTSWPGQAALARDGKWDDLIGMQKALDTGRATGGGETDSKVEKLLIKAGVLRKFEKNDLKVVEGIGPKISELMNNNGVTTWAEMASSSVERLQSILDGAGDRFKLADPGTWPKQAGMADAGQWKELDEYQDFLQGGKE